MQEFKYHSIEELENKVIQLLKDNDKSDIKNMITTIHSNIIKEIEELINKDEIDIDIKISGLDTLEDQIQFLKILGISNNEIEKFEIENRQYCKDITISTKVEFRHIIPILKKYQDMLNSMICHISDKKKMIESLKNDIDKMLKKYRKDPSFKKDIFFNGMYVITFIYDTTYLKQFKGHLPDVVKKVYEKLINEYPVEFKGNKDDLIIYDSGKDLS